jgi:hypothetical protein
VRNRGVLLDAFRRAVQSRRMNQLSNFVSLHPYCKVHPEKLRRSRRGSRLSLGTRRARRRTFSMDSLSTAMKFSVAKPTRMPKAFSRIWKTLARSSPRSPQRETTHRKRLTIDLSGVGCRVRRRGRGAGFRKGFLPISGTVGALLVDELRNLQRAKRCIVSGL